MILFALQNVENVDTNKQIKSQEADEMWPVGLIEKKLEVTSSYGILWDEWNQKLLISGSNG